VHHFVFRKRPTISSDTPGSRSVLIQHLAAPRIRLQLSLSAVARIPSLSGVSPVYALTSFNHDVLGPLLFLCLLLFLG